MAQNGGKVRELTDHWSRVRGTLQSIHDMIERKTFGGAAPGGGASSQPDVLATRWASFGGQAFLEGGPLRALEALNTWIGVAEANIGVLNSLAGSIAHHQGEMQQLWARYAAEAGVFAGIDTMPDPGEQVIATQQLRGVQEKYLLKAQRLEAGMGHDYFDAALRMNTATTAPRYQALRAARETVSGRTPIVTAIGSVP